MAKLYLILGGARSGKSRYAQRLARELGDSDVLFVATASRGDQEMARRIERHRQERPQSWRTLEVETDVGGRLANGEFGQQVVLVDCLTLLVSNVLLKSADPLNTAAAESLVNAELETLFASCRERCGTVILVTSEVGMGLVPNSPLGRVYRDLLGRANQRAAAAADRVLMLVAGIAIDVRSLAVPLPAHFTEDSDGAHSQ